MSGGIHQTVSSATFLKSIQYHLCVGCHPWQRRGHLSLKQILLENKGHREMGGEWRGGGSGGEQGTIFFLCLLTLPPFEGEGKGTFCISAAT